MHRIIAHVFAALLSVASVSAVANSSINSCLSHVDRTGCLLQLAKRQVEGIQNAQERADSLVKVIKVHADLKRTDFKLIEAAESILEKKKTSVGTRLELHTALSAYFSTIDPEVSLRQVEAAINVFQNAKQLSNPSTDMDLSVWICGLIDSHPSVWKLMVDFVAYHCSSSQLPSISSDNQIDRFIATSLSASAAWLHSDLTQYRIQRESLLKQIDELEKIEKYKASPASAIVHFLRIIQLIADVDRFWREYDQDTARRYFVLAIETLKKMEALGIGEYSIASRIEIANFLNFAQKFEDSIAVLKPLVDRYHISKKSAPFKNSQRIEMLVALAYAMDSGGFRDPSEAKGAVRDVRNRRNEVLYARYESLPDASYERPEQIKAKFLALSEAAESGHLLAMHNLGVLYQHGLGGAPKDSALAIYWYTRAALLGMPGAQNNLGHMYEMNLGSPQDIGLAIHFYTQAAMQGEPTAYLSLGELFAKGKGIPRSDVSAATWLTLAARDLPEGTNMEKAKALRDDAMGRLDEQEKRSVARRVLQFVPLRQTEHKMSDAPQVGRWM